METTESQTGRDSITIDGLGTVIRAQPDYLATLYPHLVSDERLNAYLNTTRLRVKNRWKDVPEPSDSVDQLTDAFAKISRFVLRTFVKRKGGQTARAIVKNHGLEIRAKRQHQNQGDEDTHEGEDRDIVHSPSLVVRAAGSSFEYPSPSLATGWTNVASIFNAVAEQEMENMEPHIREFASYARRIFYAQPNRMFIRFLIISQSHAVLVHFDRSGCEYSHPFNIHNDPKTFIRLLVGLNSTDEQLLGFDTSVRWKISRNRKTSGTVDVCGEAGEKRTYDLKYVHPIFKRDGVRGRGTMCWVAFDPTTKQEVVIKDTWRLGTRRPEYEMLKLGRGLAGVCQMLDYEHARGQTGNFRSVREHEKISVRIFERIVMEKYGVSIEHFKTPLQALIVVRDAIEGHSRLVGRNILHCDISTNNILFGFPNVVGHRGVLTDLDMAVELKQFTSGESTENRIGTRTFQSIYTLKSFFLGPMPPHDYLDDLESFFYVICFLLLLFYGYGGKKSTDHPAHELIRDWTLGLERHSSNAKWSFVTLDDDFLDECVGYIDESWGEPARQLFLAFREFTKTIVEAKSRLNSQRVPPPTTPGGTPLHRFSSLHDEKAKHYATVLKLFDEAIAEYQSQSPSPYHLQEAVSNTPIVAEETLMINAASPPPLIPSRTSRDEVLAVVGTTELSRKRQRDEEHNVSPEGERRPSVRLRRAP